MQLRPRHYLLLAIILGLFVYNIIRHRRDTRPALATTPAPVVVTPTKPRLNTPAWAAFDHAASLRDASDAEYQPAIKDLNQLIPLDPVNTDPNQTDNHIADIKGCRTWLDFYRQGMAQSHADPKMKARAAHHLDTCTQLHLDTTA
jgi:hypothetical protein